jgi:hypothetical protein
VIYSACLKKLTEIQVFSPLYEEAFKKLHQAAKLRIKSKRDKDKSLKSYWIGYLPALLDCFLPMFGFNGKCKFTTLIWF